MKIYEIVSVANWQLRPTRVWSLIQARGTPLGSGMGTVTFLTRFML